MKIGYASKVKVFWNQIVEMAAHIANLLKVMNNIFFMCLYCKNCRIFVKTLRQENYTNVFRFSLTSFGTMFKCK